MMILGWVLLALCTIDLVVRRGQDAYTWMKQKEVNVKNDEESVVTKVEDKVKEVVDDVKKKF